MSYSKTGSFGWAGGGKNGAIVDLWATTRFVGFPAEDQAPPAGNPDAGPVTTGVNFGNPGAYVISGISVLQDYFVRIQYGGHTYWGSCPSGSLNGVGTASATWGAWQQVSTGVGFQNGWGDDGAPSALTAYRLDATGQHVELAGGVNGGSGVAFTLPLAARPITQKQIAVSRVSATAGFITIATTGTVTPSAAVHLDGVIFPLDW